MNIYKVTVNEWFYWKNSNESGYIAKDMLFLNKNHAKKLLNELEQNPYWFNHKGEKVYTDSHKPYAEMIEMKTED